MSGGWWRAGHPVWTLWEIHFVRQLPNLSLHRALAGENWHPLSEGWRRARGTENTQGSYVLWVRKLSELRFHLLEEAAETALSEVWWLTGDREQTRSSMHELPGIL